MHSKSILAAKEKTAVRTFSNTPTGNTFQLWFALRGPSISSRVKINSPNCTITTSMS